ncbi:MAG TPA: hypothetical protein PKD90_02925 [Phnomibacter sp.]|nr:hypothetical protein [Phnomibacter sp.]
MRPAGYRKIPLENSSRLLNAYRQEHMHISAALAGIGLQPMWNELENLLK